MTKPEIVFKLAASSFDLLRLNYIPISNCSLYHFLKVSIDKKLLEDIIRGSIKHKASNKVDNVTVYPDKSVFASHNF